MNPRALARAILLCGIIALGLTRRFAGTGHSLPAKCRWMQWMSRRFLALLKCEVCVSGVVPSDGLIVSNHLGYLDILVIGSVCPAVFVAKSDVREWPVFGLLAALSGTIFVQRRAGTTVRDQLDTITGPLQQGFPVVLFPEGTSSDGTDVLPFRSSLLESAFLTSRAITPAAISYEAEGDVGREVCYWGDMVFAPHLLNLLGKKSLRARLHFAPSRPPAGTRKDQARALRNEIRELLRAHPSG